MYIYIYIYNSGTFCIFCGVKVLCGDHTDLKIAAAICKDAKVGNTTQQHPSAVDLRSDFLPLTPIILLQLLDDIFEPIYVLTEFSIKIFDKKKPIQSKI